MDNSEVYQIGDIVRIGSQFLRAIPNEIGVITGVSELPNLSYLVSFKGVEIEIFPHDIKAKLLRVRVYRSWGKPENMGYLFLGYMLVDLADYKLPFELPREATSIKLYTGNKEDNLKPLLTYEYQGQTIEYWPKDT